jgi:hypothetical protein
MHRLPGGPRIAFRIPTVRRQVGPRREPRRDFLELLAQCPMARPARRDRALKPLPSSLTRGRRACPLALRPGQRRAILGALNPPPSSSLAEEERLRSLRFHLLAPLAEAGAWWPLPFSLARIRKACMLPRSSRTAARQTWSVRRRAIPDARSGFTCWQSNAWAIFRQSGVEGALRPQADALRRTMRICCPGTACAA